MKKRGRAEESSGWTTDNDGAVTPGALLLSESWEDPAASRGDGSLAPLKSGLADELALGSSPEICARKTFVRVWFTAV